MVCCACGNRLASSITRASPPCSSTICRNFSSALPDEINCALCCFPSATVFETPPRCSIHPASSRHSSRKSSGPPPRNTSHDLDDFQRVADHVAQWLIHIGDQRDDLLAHPLPGFDHQFGEEGRVFLALHERARSGLHVEHQSINAFRQFLAHDRRANQVWALDRAGHIAQRVQACDRREQSLPSARSSRSRKSRARGETQRREDSR